MSSVLILSNGHGEDSMGAQIGAYISELEPELGVLAYPLVGEGRAYEAMGIERVATTRVMPSGGFILEQKGALRADLKAGLLGEVWRQTRKLGRLRDRAPTAVAVGDIYPLIMGAWFLRRPLVFLPTAKSDYIRRHYAFEVWLMRQACRLVFPRDVRTAESLREQGVNAVCVGNLMMDALIPSGERFDLCPECDVVALLPGSRPPEAYRNAELILAAAASLGQDEHAHYGFLLALAGGLDPQMLATAAAKSGWSWYPGDERSAGRGIAGWLRLPGSEASAEIIADEEGPRLRVSGSEVVVVSGRFADVLGCAHVAIGMAGTGNEQAVGAGVPVVAPTGEGPQFTQRFVADQKRLLGDALVETPPEPAEIAGHVRSVLGDRQRRAYMRKIGAERMGGPGATERVARAVISLAQGAQE